LRLGFAGTPEFAVAALDALAGSRHTLAAVFTKPDRPAGRGQAVQQSPVRRRAATLGLPVHQPESFKTPEVLATLRGLELDALIVVAYGLILPAAALAAPRLGCFNIHASLLPRWRGAAPIHRAVLAGDATTGVTIMRMETGLDTGPRLAARSLAIEADETTGRLHDRLARLGGELIVETLDSIANGSAREEPQPAAGITYAEKISKAEAVIDWNADAAQIVRRVRAFNPWPIAETKLDGVQLRLWEAEVAPAASIASQVPIVPGATISPCTQVPPGTVLAAATEGIDVACGSGVVRILRLQLAGRKPLAAQEFIKAHPVTGARLVSS
jgi:methionyl-tRNA formyltransferase